MNCVTSNYHRNISLLNTGETEKLIKTQDIMQHRMNECTLNRRMYSDRISTYIQFIHTVGTIRGHKKVIVIYNY